MEAIAAEFGKGKSLYEVLDIPRAAPQEVIKKAYFKLALKCHPDKCPGDKAAKGRFQALSLVHSVLADPDRRSVYDESGDIVEEGQDDRTEDEELWYDYWRTLFPKITVADIEAFGNKYQGSEEESRDVVQAYKKHKGNMNAIVDSIMLATQADEERFRAVIDAAIESKQAAPFAALPKGAKTGSASKRAATKRKAKIDKEAAEAEELAAMIKGRQQDRTNSAPLSTHRAREFNDLVSSLESKYGGGKAGGTSRKGGRQESKRAKKDSSPNLDDAEFDRIQKKLMGSRSK